MPSTITGQDLGLCYKIEFAEHVQCQHISVNEDFLEYTRQKVVLTRFVNDELDQDDFVDGPPTQSAKSLATYWTQSYDWRKAERELNTRLCHYTVVVRPSPNPANFAHDVPLHFVHHRSSHADAIPLLFVHGWPGSFLEVLPIIDQLTNPSDETLPAFHVVAPSIPGYGFSPSTRAPGMGYRAAAAVFHALMTEKLGYKKYVFQGGDAGDFINRYAAHDFPGSVVSGHSNFWVVPPTASEMQDLRQRPVNPVDDESYVVSQWSTFFSSDWGYGHIQQTRPLKLAHAMTDSPIGLAMWIYDAVVMGIEPHRRSEVWTPERVITWTMMHWFNGPYGPFSLYKQGAKDGAISPTGINLLPYVSQPVAISQFPYDIWYRTPLHWARRGGNVVERVVHGEGGHFPALTNSDLLLQDMWNFFGDRELSNTKVFSETGDV